MRRNISKDAADLIAYFDQYIDAYAEKYKFSRPKVYELMGLTGRRIEETPIQIYEVLETMLPSSLPAEEKDKLLHILAVRSGLDSIHLESFSATEIAEIAANMVTAMICIHQSPPSTLGKMRSPKAGKRPMTTQLFEKLAWCLLKDDLGTTNKAVALSLIDPKSFEQAQARFFEGNVFFKADFNETKDSKRLVYRDEVGVLSSIDLRSLENLVSRMRKVIKFTDDRQDASHSIDPVIASNSPQP